MMNDSVNERFFHCCGKVIMSGVFHLFVMFSGAPLGPWRTIPKLSKI
jgi:hypothetical protein